MIKIETFSTCIKQITSTTTTGPLVSYLKITNKNEQKLTASVRVGVRVSGRIVELFGGTLLPAPVGLQRLVVRLLPVVRGLVGGRRRPGSGPGRHGRPDLVVFVRRVASDHWSCGIEFYC